MEAVLGFFPGNVAETVGVHDAPSPPLESFQLEFLLTMS